MPCTICSATDSATDGATPASRRQPLSLLSIEPCHKLLLFLVLLVLPLVSMLAIATLTHTTHITHTAPRAPSLRHVPLPLPR